jgi:ArsR family transcriptional regulator
MSIKYKKQSEFCKLFGNERRLQILQALRFGAKNAGELCDILGISPANLSQHISLLKQAGAVRDNRQGNNIYYELGHPKILDGMDMMEGVLQDIVNEYKTQFNEQGDVG